MCDLGEGSVVFRREDVCNRLNSIIFLLLLHQQRDQLELLALFPIVIVYVGPFVMSGNVLYIQTVARNNSISLLC